MSLTHNPTVRLAVHQLKHVEPFVKRGRKLSRKAILEALEFHPHLEFIIVVTGQHANLSELKKAGNTEVTIRFNDDRDCFVHKLV